MIKTRQKILVIDDSKSVRDYTIDLLDKAGFEALGASDGQKGLRCIEEFKPDVVLLDIVMPGMSGLDVLRRLRNNTGLLSVLLFSTKSAISDVVVGLDAGADDYIVKPFEDGELIARVRAAAKRVILEKELTKARNEAEKNLKDFRKAQAELIHQGRLAGIARLAVGVAHEINNPLYVIQNNIEMLVVYGESLLRAVDILEQFTSDTEGRHTHSQDRAMQWLNDNDVKGAKEDLGNLCRDTLQDVDRIAKIVKAFSRMGRVATDEQDLIDPNEIIGGILQHVSGNLPHNVNISFNEKTTSEVSCNGEQVKIALLNVINNAVDAVSGGGEVVLSTYQEKGGSCIEVRDTGIGIPSSNLASVFDPFYTTKDVGKGIGLGLTIADSIVRSYGGNVRIKSSGETGTEVALWLPAG